MNDTIYRQEAIDEWKNDFKGYINALDIPHDDYKGIMEYIDEVPSAQPEIIRCKDCKNSEHWYADRRRCFLWSEDGVSVFDDGFCNYAERRMEEA